MRVLENYKGESLYTLEQAADMAWVLKLNEYLDMTDYIKEVHEDEMEREADQKAKNDKAFGKTKR